MYACTTESPKCWIMARTSATPLWLAAICARRSARFVAGLRGGGCARVSRAKGAGAGARGRKSKGLRPGDRPGENGQRVVERPALPVRARAGRRHRSGRQPADLGVMSAGRDVEEDPPVVENRRDHGDVGEVGAAV